MKCQGECTTTTSPSFSLLHHRFTCREDAFHRELHRDQNYTCTYGSAWPVRASKMHCTAKMGVHRDLYFSKMHVKRGAKVKSAGGSTTSPFTQPLQMKCPGGTGSAWVLGIHLHASKMQLIRCTWCGARRRPAVFLSPFHRRAPVHLPPYLAVLCTVGDRGGTDQAAPRFAPTLHLY